MPTRVLLGDTLITKSIDENEDIIYTSDEVTISENWCLTDGKGNFYDKQKNIDLQGKEALVGYYAFSDTKYLLNCCIKARLMLKKEISTALVMYQEKYRLKTKHIEDWYDLGHTSGLIKAKNLLFNARCFNSISVDTDAGLLIKTSTKIQKLEDEALWYQGLPDELKIYTPRFVDFQKDKDKAVLIQELYGYPSLQELYLSGEVNMEDWQCIIQKLFGLHKRFEKYTRTANRNALKWLYFDKTKERIDELKSSNPYWEKHLNKDYEIINGKRYYGIMALKPEIEAFTQELSSNKTESIIHGDYCFSNILFDSNNYIFKLIDPRGRLDNEATIYGDAKYDIAKLRHSVVGLYDFIVHGLFRLKESTSGYEYTLIAPDYSRLEAIFDNHAKRYGFDVREIKFIEGLLFLSMLPLHKDDLARQKMIYIRALELLNDTLDKQEREEWKIENSEYALT